jgi:nicotinamidase-related amidase
MNGVSSSAGAALLVIDVQPVFLRVMPAGEACLRRCRLAVGAARLLGLPIFFTEQVPSKLGATHPGLLLAAGEAPRVFGKTAFSALGAPGLPEALRAEGVTHLLLAGLEGPVCVHQTALAALRADLGVTLLADAVTERRPEDGAVCREALRDAGASVLPVETVFYALLGDAAEPRFRAFTELVKQAQG